MAFIKVPPQTPGIIGLMKARPDTAKTLNALAQTLLVSDKGLTRGERELIAAWVSHRNRCNFCFASHRAFARELLGSHQHLTEALFPREGPPNLESLTPLMQQLLYIAGKVQEDATTVTEADIEEARRLGATEDVVHDTVLIAAAFCMFNRYVDGLGAESPAPDAPVYSEIARQIAEHGYVGSV